MHLLDALMPITENRRPVLRAYAYKIVSFYDIARCAQCSVIYDKKEKPQLNYIHCTKYLHPWQSYLIVINNKVFKVEHYNDALSKSCSIFNRSL